MLALGTDAALKSLAIRELKLSVALRGQHESAFPAEKAELGDAWWDLGEKHDDDMKGKLRSRAAHWYRQAAPNLSGLVKQKCEKRLEQIQETSAPNDVKTVSSSMDEKPLKTARVEPKQPAVATVPRIDSTPVCAKLEAKKPPEGLAAGTIPFTAPRGEGRSGANGFLIEAARGVGPSRHGLGLHLPPHRIRGRRSLHPSAGGGARDGHGHTQWTPRRKPRPVAFPRLPTAAADEPALGDGQQFRAGVGHRGGRTAQSGSILAPDGRFQFLLDGQLLAVTVVPPAAPLQLTPDFQGEKLPMTLRPGMAGVIIGPRDGGLNRATDITFGLLASGECVSEAISSGFAPLEPASSRMAQ